MKLTTKLCAAGVTLATTAALGLVPRCQRLRGARAAAAAAAAPRSHPADDGLLDDQPGHRRRRHVRRLVHADLVHATRTASSPSPESSPAP